MTAAALWTAVKTSYDADGLITLTNIRDRAAATIDDTAGQDAAQGVIDLWPAFAEETYDSADSLHVEVAKQGVIALLWRRGGSATTIEQVKWEEIFGPDGLIARVRRTGARGRPGPSSNSGVVTGSDLSESGRESYGWSDRKALPTNFLPRRTFEE
jgi:hypothetical protein